MKELSNWGRWGADDELGAANLITPAKRKQAVALAKEGRAISLAHDVVQEKAEDAPNILERVIVNVSPTVATDRYQYTGTYHGVIHSHLDAVDCHIMFDGKGYNGRLMEDIKATGGCPKGNINALKDGVVTRGILFDATRLPGKAGPQGWLEPGTAIHREDLEAMEKIERCQSLSRRRHPSLYGPVEATRGAGSVAEHERVRGLSRRRCVLHKERGVSFIGCDGPNDVSPTGVPRRS